VLALWPGAVSAQGVDVVARVNPPSSAVAFELQPGQAPAQGVQDSVTEAVKRWNIGVYGGVALDPEMITVGAYGTLGKVFSPAVSFQPGLYLSFGELTTEFGIDLDVTYTLPGERTSAWHPYIGGGLNFALSHQGFEAPVDNSGSVTTPTPTSSTGTTTTTSTTTTSTEEDTSRFNFSDTSFDTGLNFIVGARRASGVFFEMKATAYGVSSVKLLAGFRF